MAVVKNFTLWYTLIDNTNIKKKKKRERDREREEDNRIVIPVFYACRSLLLLLEVYF